jgi:hypothetical protein
MDIIDSDCSMALLPENYAKYFVFPSFIYMLRPWALTAGTGQGKLKI